MPPSSPPDLSTKLILGGLALLGVWILLRGRLVVELEDQLQVERRLRIEAERRCRVRDEQLDGALAKIHELVPDDHGAGAA